MELTDLYHEENKELLRIFSWFNKNSLFDRSGGMFAETDLFTFLERVAHFDYNADTKYDDVYYILQYVEETVLHLFEHINKEIRREHLIVPISQAKEFDNKSIMWLSRQDGRTIREKIKGNRLKAVKRYSEIDTHENRVFKTLLKKLFFIYENRNDLGEYDYLFSKIRKWLRSEEAEAIDEYRKIVYNNILLHHKHYSKIFKSFKWLNSLTDKINNLHKDQSAILPLILRVDMLSRLQFNSRRLVKPERLVINHAEFKLALKLEEILPEQIDLMTIKLGSQDTLTLEHIPEIVEKILTEQMDIVLDQDRSFKIDTSVCKEVYMDIFRTYPICRSNGKTQDFPITIKQKIGNQIVNASNTKVIDLDYEILTLPEILKSYDIEIFKYFLNDFKSMFGDARIHYIVPDYVNIFEFSQVKKIFNSYFKKSKSAPKSVLAGLKYLLESGGQVGDTLVYIQKNHNEDIFVTPLLIKYDDSLDDVTRGLYLEKHPTRKMVSTSQISDTIRVKFSDEIADKLLNKFLQNGIRRICDDKVAFLYQDKLEYLEDFDLPNLGFDDQSVNDFRKLHSHQSLFRKEMIILNDTDAENLQYFEQMLDLHKDGHVLWKEHLPGLAMEIVKSGYCDRFVLVDDNSEVRDNHITIDETFVIPANVDELSFPLIFNDENIPYKAYLSGKDFPYPDDVECTLELKYDYEDETPYRLRFIPFDKSYTPISVKWVEYRFDPFKDTLIYPDFPPRKKWEDFKHDPKPNGNGTSDLFDWILARLSSLDSFNELESKVVQQGYFVQGKINSYGNYFCFVNVDGQKIYCNSNDFLEKVDVEQLREGAPVFLSIIEKDGRISGKNVAFSEEGYHEKVLMKIIDNAVKRVDGMKYPLYTVWNNHSLTDSDAPNLFREKIMRYIDLSLSLIADKNIPSKLKKSLFFFLSSLHKDMPLKIAEQLIRFSKTIDDVKKYSDNIATAIGDATLPWQKELYNNILFFLDTEESLRFSEIQAILGILSIVFWRSENLIFELNEYQVGKINQQLLIQMKTSFVHVQNDIRNIKVLAQKLELLLAMLRLREKRPYLIPKQGDTLSFLNVVDEITQYFIVNQIPLKSKLKILVDKGEAFTKTPDLLYALRIYLSGENHNANSIKILGVNED